MDDQGTLLKQVFGESSDSDSDDCEQPRQLGNRSENFGQTPSWLRIKEINGLYLCVDFLSPQHQSSLLSAIQNEGWFTDASHNQAMRFGDLPTWATKLSDSIREAVLLSDNDLATCDGDKEACPLPPDLLWREPLFDQLIVNVYQPGHLCAC